MKLSVVVPIYGSKETLEELHRRVASSVQSVGLRYELILVNDACPHGSWEVVKKIAESDPAVIALNLSRNFGQYSAIAAGVDACSGDYLVVMDCDLQNRPEEIPPMFEKMKKGYDIVLAKRRNRGDSLFRKLGSLVSRKLLRFLTDSTRDPLTCNFGMYNRKVIEAVRSMPEYAKAFEKQIDWVGFQVAHVDVEHGEREFGVSAYTLPKLIKYAFDQIFSYSYKPLTMSVHIGSTIAILSFFYALYLFIHAAFIHESVAGWTSLMVSLWFFSGLIIFILGMIGVYIGKILDEVKKRPSYIVKESINLPSED